MKTLIRFASPTNRTLSTRRDQATVRKTFEKTSVLSHGVHSGGGTLARRSENT